MARTTVPTLPAMPEMKSEVIEGWCGAHDAIERRMIRVTMPDDTQIWLCAESGRIVQGSVEPPHEATGSQE